MILRVSSAVVVCALACSGARAYFTANLAFGSPQDSIGTFGFAFNDTLTFNFGAPIQIIGVGWDTTLHTFGNSWASDAHIAFSDGGTGPGATLLLDVNPGSGIDAPAPSSGIHFTVQPIKLADIGIPDININSGILQFEFYESVDDILGADAQWNSTITVLYNVLPSPATWCPFALGLAALSRRRRA
ncbi:MAG: hypothetical protein R3B57_05395 [Phycisphaerales bacterium]